MTSLLDIVLDAHGGLARWRHIQRVNVRVSISGALFILKRQPEPLEDVLVEIDTRRPHLTLSPYPRPGVRGRFTGDAVRLLGTDGLLLDELVNPRASFDGHVRETPWSPLQRLYFMSYAMWNYFTTPFLLAEPGVEAREIEPYRDGGETLRRLAITLPAGIPTHSAEQVFYVDERGLIQRLDYVVDIAGAAGAHYCYDHKTFDGFVFPTLRRIVPRPPSGPRLAAPSSILLRVHDVSVA